MNVVDLLLSAESIDGRPAIFTADGVYARVDLDRAVSRLAAWLVAQSISKGERVILVAENSYFWVVSYLATMRAGAVVVPLPASSSVEDIRHVARTTESRLVFLQAKRAALHVGALDGHVGLVFDEQCAASSSRGGRLLSEILEHQHQDVQCPSTDASDLAALMFTSGSTGRPRGVMISHGNIAANTRSIIEYLALTHTDRMMVVLPMCYGYGASLLHTHLSVGGSVVLDSRFMFPDKVLQRMQETKCTGLAGVPSHYQILLRRSSFSSMRFPTLRLVQQAGGRLSDALIRELARCISPAQLFVMYGLTEATTRLTVLPPSMLEAKVGSVGRAIPGVRVRVVDPSGREVAPGESGELVAEGANVALGYWRDPAATAESFSAGVLHTGDIAKVDADGYLYIVDRERDFVKCGGVRTSSAGIEQVLLEHPRVIEAAIIAVPDDMAGEAVQAYIVVDGADRDDVVREVHSLCDERLRAELRPKKIVLVANLPKNEAGKIMKRQLREITS